jgi:hypothetical protein
MCRRNFPFQGYIEEDQRTDDRTSVLPIDALTPGNDFSGTNRDEKCNWVTAVLVFARSLMVVLNQLPSNRRGVTRPPSSLSVFAGRPTPCLRRSQHGGSDWPTNLQTTAANVGAKLTPAEQLDSMHQRDYAHDDEFLIAQPSRGPRAARGLAKIWLVATGLARRKQSTLEMCQMHQEVAIDGSKCLKLTKFQLGQQVVRWV